MLEKAHDFEGLERDAALTTVVLQGAEITSEFESRIEEIVSNLPISLSLFGIPDAGFVCCTRVSRESTVIFRRFTAQGHRPSV